MKEKAAPKKVKTKRKSIFLTLAFAFSLLFGGTLSACFDSSDGGGWNRHLVEETESLCTIKFVKGIFPSSGITLRNEVSKDSPFDYFDYEGKVGEQFLAMEFTLTGSGLSPYSGDTCFTLTHSAATILVTFSPDFFSMNIQAEKGDLFGHLVTKNKTYQADPEEGAKLKNLIDSQISEQKLAYETKEAEMKANTTLNDGIAAMEEEEVKSICIYFYSREIKDGFHRVKDPDKEILEVLKEIDASEMVSIEEPESFQYDIYYYAISCSFSFHYQHLDHCLMIARSYEGPYQRNQVLKMYFQIPEQQGNELMSVAARIAETNEPSN